MIIRKRLTVPRQFRSIPLLALLVMFTYWVFNYWVLLSLIEPAVDFFTTVAKYLSGQSLSAQEAARPYLESTAAMTHVAFAWAVPPAVVTSYILHRLHGELLGQDRRAHNHWAHKMLEFGSVLGLIMTLFSFILARYGHYSYLITPKYAILGLSMILILPKLLSYRNGIVTIITVFILAVFLFIGSSSPDWPLWRIQIFLKEGCYIVSLYLQGDSARICLKTPH